MPTLDEFLPESPQRQLFVDEQVEYVWEVVRDKPMWGAYRYQHIKVRRGERMCEFIKEMGPASAFPGPEVQAWLGGLYSVGEAMDIAQMLREGKDPEPQPASDIVGQYQKQLEEKDDLRHHRTTSGPHLTIARS